jgi:hypothetical protein
MAYWTGAAYTLSVVAVFLDLIEWIQTFAMPDLMSCKSFDNLASSLVKFAAFGMIVGCGTLRSLDSLQNALCYNNDGARLLLLAEQHYYIYAVTIFMSAVGSFFEAPISALYGGKMQGGAYMK